MKPLSRRELTISIQRQAPAPAPRNRRKLELGDVIHVVDREGKPALARIVQVRHDWMPTYARLVDRPQLVSIPDDVVPFTGDGRGA